MSIRWKLLTLLLVFSLTPLLLVSGISHRGVKQLGKIIANLAGKHRTEIVSRELQQTAEDYAKILGREKEILELSLKVIARDAERFLADSPKSDSELYFAEDFDSPDRAPADMIRSSKHFRDAAAGGIEPMPISFGHQVFRLAPGLDKRFVAKDIARLAGLLPLHKEFESQLGDILYWQYVSLESGIHASYPGHGGYPPGYNPQERPWYVLAVEQGKLAWSTPYIDATTRQVIMTASMPVHRPDGSIAGVAAIDTLLSEVLQVNELSSQWSPAMRSFLIWSGRDHKTGEFGLWVVAQKDHLKEAATWSGLIEVERLVSSNQEAMNRLVKDIEARKSGYLEMKYEGVNSIWSYAYAGEDVSLVLIVAKGIILAEVEQVRKAVFLLAKEQWLVTGIAAAALILLLILAAFPFSQAMTRPMMVMVEAVKRLAKGDFSARMDIDTGDERDLVATSFNDMVPQLEDRMRIRKALEVAQEVQQNLLPQEIPDLPGFDIAANAVYCDETGGDYFDFFPCEDRDCHRFGIVVGDVTGHGVGAALLMATARALIRGLTTNPESLAECISRVNNLLTADVRQTGRFMSLFFLMIEAGSPTFSWVRAGHDPAILYDPGADRFEELLGPGMVLGVEENYTYEQVEKTIETSGAIILIGTDGIWEAHNGDGDMFGKERLYEIIRTNADKSAEAIQDAVLEAINKFRGDFPQEDDITIVVIKVL
jgi:sigma-B regulation protein RsbU (phosphoserine phosphatase)